jgi:hypothetical protein
MYKMIPLAPRKYTSFSSQILFDCLSSTIFASYHYGRRSHHKITLFDQSYEFKMKFPGLATAVTALLQLVHADFHISITENAEFIGDGAYDYIAYPSDRYGCATFEGLNGYLSHITTLQGGVPLSDISFFTFGTDFCGAQYGINFYKNSDGETWDFYQAGASTATLLGTCYPSDGSDDCILDDLYVQDVLVCYSSLCN